jgi:hypothetical protein
MACSFTSCISIIEKVFFKKDGSGTYSMTLDMSQVSNMLTMLGEDQKPAEMDEAFKGMNEGFEKSRAKLEGIKGISNIQQEMDKKTLVYTVSFDFKDVNALNNGLNEYFANEENRKDYTLFTQDKKRFSRTSEDRFAEALNEGLSVGEDTEFDPAIFMADAYFESVLVFERDIKSFSNEEYKRDGDRRITIKKFFFNKNDADKDLAVTVKVK